MPVHPLIQAPQPRPVQALILDLLHPLPALFLRTLFPRLFLHHRVKTMLRTRSLRLLLLVNTKSNVCTTWIGSGYASTTT